MSRKSLRMLMCAAVAASFGMFGTASKATFYGGDFDPDVLLGHFTGHFLINVSDTCNSTSCQIDLISLSITDSGTFGPGWFAAAQTNIGTHVLVDGPLIAFDSILINLLLPSFEFSSGIFASTIPCTPSLKFTSEFSTDFNHHSGFIADMECTNSSQVNVGDNAVYTLVQVPEPGTLVLLVGGIGAAWLSRRRKTTTA